MSVKFTLVSLLLAMGICFQLPAFANEAPEKPVLTVQSLHMNALPAEWWRVLEGDATPLKDRTQSLLALANSYQSTASPEEQERLTNLWESIQANTQALLSLREKVTPQLPKTIGFLDAYSLEAWQDALQSLRKEKEQLEVAKAGLDQAQAQRDAIGREADDVTAQYLSYSSDDAHKVELSLDMLDKRLAWLVAKESERLHMGQLDIQTQRVAHAVDVWQKGNERFSVNAETLKQLNEQLSVQRQQVERKIDAVRSAQADAVVIWGDDELSRAKGLAQHAIATKASIDLAETQALVIWLTGVQIYVRLNIPNTPLDRDRELRDAMPTWVSELTNLTNQRKLWRGTLENQREQVQSNLLALTETPPEGLSTKQLVQVKQTYQQALQTIASALSGLKGLHGQISDTEDVLALLRAWLLKADGVWASRWHDVVAQGQSVAMFTGDMLTASLFKVGDTPVTTLGIIRMFVFITLAWWLSFWLRKGLAQVSSRNDKIAPHTAYTLGRLIHYVVMTIGMVVALSSVGIDFSNVAWIAGALSVGIGFGLQAVVNNFVSGLIVMFERTLKVGDFIELPSGVSGTVREIRLRSTLITTGDNLEIVVPNAEFMTGRVVNWTLSDLYRRVHVPFNVKLGSDKRDVVAAVLEAAALVPYTLHDKGRTPQVVLNSLDGKMVFELLVWIKQGSVKHNYGVKASYLWQIETALRARDIELV